MPEIEAIATDTGRTGTGRAESGPHGAGGKAHHEPRRHSPRRRKSCSFTSRYRFADSEEGFRAAVTEIGLPCIVKPVMSSSGKGQSFIRSADQLSEAGAMRSRAAALAPDG